MYIDDSGVLVLVVVNYPFLLSSLLMDSKNYLVPSQFL